VKIIPFLKVFEVLRNFFQKVSKRVKGRALAHPSPTDKPQFIAPNAHFFSTLPTVEREIAKWLSDFLQKTTVERFICFFFCGKMVLQTKNGAKVV
jgi:hypothetical protein